MGHRESYGTISYRECPFDGSFVLTPARGETITVKKVTGEVCNAGLGTLVIEEVADSGRLLNPGGGTVTIGKVTGHGYVRNWNGGGDGVLKAGTVTIGKVTGRGRVHNEGNGTVTIDELAGNGCYENVSGRAFVIIDEVTSEARVVERAPIDGGLSDGGTGLVKKAKGRSRIVVCGGSVEIEEFLGKAGVLLRFGVVVLPASAAGRVSGWFGSDLEPGVVGGTVSAVVEAAVDYADEDLIGDRRYRVRRPARFRWVVG
ncbi:hypothetical protein AB0C69_05170 [Actinomadura sp. NPDC048032]|uniref:hypothetical protein n=1 Tax=Actinomadura sp. NPDC048032 TaxID=3155747 RepID=UPI0033FA5F0F